MQDSAPVLKLQVDPRERNRSELTAAGAAAMESVALEIDKDQFHDAKTAWQEWSKRESAAESQITDRWLAEKKRVPPRSLPLPSTDFETVPESRTLPQS